MRKAKSKKLPSAICLSGHKSKQMKYQMNLENQGTLLNIAEIKISTTSKLSTSFETTVKMT